MTTETRQRRDALKMSSYGDLRRREWPAREYVIGPWLRQGESVMLWAPTGLGKTMVALTIALAVAGGGSVMGWAASKPRPVMLLDGEMHIQDIYDRLEMLAPTIEGLDVKAAMRNLVVLSRTDQTAEARFPNLADAEDHDEVLGRAAGMGAELVICDNFSTLAEVDDENAAAAMNPVLGFLLKAKGAGMATMLIHHADKQGFTYRGSSKLAATFEVIIGLHKLIGRPITAGTGFELRWDKYRGKPTASTRDMAMELMTPDEGFGGGPKWDVKPASSAEMDAMLDALMSREFRSQKELAAHLGWDKTKLSKVKSAAIVVHRRITDREWDACLKGDCFDDGGPSDF